MCLLYEENADRDLYVGGFVRAGFEAGEKVLVEREASQPSESGDRLVLSAPPAFLQRVLEVLDLDQPIEVAA